jgi:PAS domain S-box-containing protein
MLTIHSEKRKSGISAIGKLPWGSHFCQFYQTKNDLLDILVPFFKAGLEHNEHCLWITSGALGVEDATAALKKAVPRFGKYAEKGQLEILSESRWLARGGKSGKAIVSRHDKAVSLGFDGLRFSMTACAEKKGSRTFTCHGAAIVGRYNVLALYTYPRDAFNAMGLMEVVKNHRLALVKNGGAWAVIEGSEARMVKDALKRSEEKLQTLFSNMSEGFAYHRVVLDAAGKPCDYVFLEVNEAFEKLTGLKGKRIIGRRATDVLPGLERDPADLVGKYGKVALTGKPVFFESYAEALKRWYAISAFSPHKGYFATTFNDITERKRYQEELEWKTLRLEAANRELETFSYSVSHDLRAPLRSVDAFSQELLEDYAEKLDENGRDSLQRIRAASQRMGVLIDGLLNLSRITRSELKQEQVDLSALARGIADELKTLHPEREVEFTISEGLVVTGDERLLHVVMQNLLGNAWKFSGTRKKAKIEVAAADAAGTRAYCVKDNGAGFDMAYGGKLFTPFQRLHDGSEFPGTGIGLATVNRIIQRHGGRIWAEGAVDHGAAFYFTVGP